MAREFTPNGAYWLGVALVHIYIDGLQEYHSKLYYLSTRVTKTS
jgi:hypothetical protein